MNPFRDTLPMTPAKKRGPVEITPEEAHELIRASWPQRSGSGLRLVQPIAAEAATDAGQEQADHEYDWPRTDADRTHAARFWRVYLAATLLSLAAAVWQFWPA